MLKVRDIMSADVVSVSPDTTLRDAMSLFAARHISGAPVVDGGRVVGVVSTRDLLALAAAVSIAPEPGTAPPAEETEVAIEPVIDGSAAPAGRSPSGAPTEAGDTGGWGDLPGWTGTPAAYYREAWAELPADASRPAPLGDRSEWSPLDEHTVAEAMSDAVIAVVPDEDVTRAGALMDRAKIHRLLVVDRGRLAGIVSVLDVARAVAEHRLTSRRYVFTPHGARREREERDEDR